MTGRLLIGDCRETLRTLPEGSVHCCVTSPPYWGLRDYGLPPGIWGGADGCEHEWGGNVRSPWANAVAGPNAGGKNEKTRNSQKESGAFCQLCGAWRGCLGSEPTPEQFVANMVEVFREVKRVLRDDGTLALNLGDSYSSGNRTGHGTRVGYKQQTNRGMSGEADPARAPQPPGLKQKDLCGIPWRVAFALQADGWYLRAAIPWVKSNAMPESTTDRPTVSHETIFLLAKSGRYYWDAEAVKVASLRAGDTQTLGGAKGRSYEPSPDSPDFRGGHHQRGRDIQVGASRSRRTGDWARESMEAAVQDLRARADHLEAVLEGGKLALDDDGDPLALFVNPQPFRGAHFATYPPRLVEPFVKAGTSERGVCAECGAPWRRVVQKTGGRTGRSWHPHDDDPHVGMSQAHRLQGTKEDGLEEYRCETIGWAPTCTCGCEETVPATVLDPFMGAGTTAVVAEALGRGWIGCELNEQYAAIARERIEQERLTPMQRDAREAREELEAAGQLAMFAGSGAR